MARRKKCPFDIKKELGAAISSSSSFQTLLNHLPTKSEDNAFQEYYRLYLVGYDEIYKKMHEAISKFVKQPLFIAFLAWAKESQPVDKEIVNYAHILVREGFLPLLDKEGKVYSIASAKYFDHKEIIDSIRARRDLFLESRESLVHYYIMFTNWLEHQTFDYVSRAFDPDHMKRQGRIIDYSIFIKILTHLDEKAQLVAKLLYFGGSRTLEEVLSLDMENVDFKNRTIRYDTQIISYPTHIFGDITALVQERKTGRLFFGRQNAPLNPATIFRNFKEAGSKVGFGDLLSPKSFTTNG